MNRKIEQKNRIKKFVSKKRKAIERAKKVDAIEMNSFQVGFNLSQK